MSDYPVENLLREPTEVYTSITCLALTLLAINKPHLFLLTQTMGYYAGIGLTILAIYRGVQAFRVKRFHRRLIKMPYYALSTKQVPVSQQWLFIGRGWAIFLFNQRRIPYGYTTDLCCLPCCVQQWIPSRAMGRCNARC